MDAHPPAGPPHGLQRGDADGWVDLGDGRRAWGRAGAAGLLAVSPSGSVLLQHRIPWSHFGDTWGLPGGARNLRESARDGAFREAREETGIDTTALEPLFESVLDLGAWSYTTVAAQAPAELAVSVSDAESTALAWVAADDVADRALHPGFGAAWPTLRPLLGDRPRIVVDVANVMGSTPDGWWRDRQGAAARLLLALAAFAADGTALPDSAIDRWWPDVVAVVEGAAKGAVEPAGITVVEAPHDGDTSIVTTVRASAAPTWVVTADRALGDRVRAAGASVVGPRWLRDRLPEPTG